MDGKIGTIFYTEERARASGNWPVIRAVMLMAGQGTLPVGLLLTEKTDGDHVPFAQVEGEVLATGDGATSQYDTILGLGLPVHPGSLVLTDGVENFRDDGLGRLHGDAGGSGVIDYETGAVDVTFAANVANATDILADYDSRISCVLDEDVDTALSTSGLAVRLGPVQLPVLKVGAVDKAAPSAAVVRKLERLGIIPV